MSKRKIQKWQEIQKTSSIPHQELLCHEGQANVCHFRKQPPILPSFFINKWSEETLPLHTVSIPRILLSKLLSALSTRWTNGLKSSASSVLLDSFPSVQAVQSSVAFLNCGEIVLLPSTSAKSPQNPLCIPTWSAKAQQHCIYQWWLVGCYCCPCVCVCDVC